MCLILVCFCFFWRVFCNFVSFVFLWLCGCVVCVSVLDMESLRKARSTPSPFVFNLFKQRPRGRAAQWCPPRPPSTSPTAGPGSLASWLASSTKPRATNQPAGPDRQCTQINQINLSTSYTLQGAAIACKLCSLSRFVEVCCVVWHD